MNNTTTREEMSLFWNRHCKDQSVEEMMLDGKASTLTKIEQPEILSLLPCLEEKRVLELGAGIGRFTGDLAKTAKHVHAIDFIEAFINKNKEMNGTKYANTSFECADVMKLEIEPHSVDVIFSNWLLMYLSDSEIQLLAKKMLTWLSVGGCVFVRESCYHPCGQLDEGEKNPTKYRSPMEYISVMDSVSEDHELSECYEFQLICGRPIEAYIELKNNKNQYCWLWKKAIIKG